MVDPADVPTIRQILENYGAGDYMPEVMYEQMVTELENRDNIMMTDAVTHTIVKALNKIIEEV